MYERAGGIKSRYLEPCGGPQGAYRVIIQKLSYNNVNFRIYNMFSNSIYTYSFIKTLYDQKRDYLDTFSPLVYSALEKDKFYTADEVKNRVKEKYDLAFPGHLVKTILSRGKRQNYVLADKEENRFQLTDSGVTLVLAIEKREDVERRINALGTDLVEYFASRGIVKKREEVATLLESFVSNNLEYLIDLFGTNGVIGNEISKSDEIVLHDYVLLATESKPDQYSTLKELIYGSIIASLVYARNTTELVELGQKSFKNYRVYLDTNIIFSALGFHTPELKQSTLELFDLIKDAGLELWAFEFTLDEICGFFRAYTVEGYKFPTTIRIDTVLSTFKQRGLGFSDINEMIVRLETTLANIGVRVQPTPEVSLKDYVSENELLRSRVSASKGVDKPISSTNHDVAAIEQVRKYRRSGVRSIEDARAIFLTADNSLNRICIQTFDHVGKGTLPETILDRLFANVLWLKNPDISLPLNLIIASHSRDLLVDKFVWERFYLVLVRLKESGSVTENQVATLFYKNQIEEHLSGIRKPEISKITDAFVTDAIEKSAKKVESEHADLQSEKLMLQQTLFESKVQVSEGIKAVDHLQKIRERIKVESKKIASQVALLGVCGLSAVLIFLEGLILFQIFKPKELLGTIVIGAIFGGGFINWNICKWAKFKIYENTYSFVSGKKMKVLE